MRAKGATAALKLPIGGTLFLDEIGNTSLDFQKNVLRVIEYQEFERTGGTQTIHVDVRVVAATNADLEREIASGQFRADLYDRLRFSVLQLPALRERPEDIRPLVEYFTQQLCDEVPAIERRPFAEGVLATLETYAWPGNVRELKFAVERALCVAQGTKWSWKTCPRKYTAAAALPFLMGAVSTNKSSGSSEACSTARSLRWEGGRKTRPSNWA